ncbi:MAG: iron-containing alcohol dehydrogenase [Spirochaetales bacterium]|nr:iron-containing alcohol dehydrogenase [Spirochaetales bacterium]
MNIWPMPQIKIGAGCINDIPTALKELNAKKVMVVTGKGTVRVGNYDKVKTVLDASGITVVHSDDVQPDPSIQLVDSIAEKARKSGVQAVIGLGGGSALDSAKVAAAMVTNEGSIRDYIGVGLLPKPGLPLIAVPTTAGTGSEVTHLSILSDLENQTKKGFGSSFVIPKYAFLDPELTTGLPQKSTAATGLDAFCHCVEAYTSANATEYTDALAVKAIKLISGNIRAAYNNGEDLFARENMLLGSLLAGMAFANAGVTAVHAFAYPLGGMFHVPHGMANSLMLPVIIKFNASSKKERFAHVAELMSGKKGADWQDCISEVEKLCEDVNLPRNLKAIDIPESAIKPMSISVMDQTRLLVNNPREVTQKDAFDLYTEAWSR